MPSEPRKTVLAVDDDRMNLRVLNGILSAEFDLLTAKTGEGALARAREAAPDIVLLDLMLPDMSGFDVLRELKGSPETRGIPVVVVSGGAGGDREGEAERLGAAGFVAKPFDGGALIEYIKAML